MHNACFMKNIFFGMFTTESCKTAPISFAISVSVCVCVTDQGLLNGFPWDVILGSLPKICWHIRTVVKIRQKMDTLHQNMHFHVNLKHNLLNIHQSKKRFEMVKWPGTVVLKEQFLYLLLQFVTSASSVSPHHKQNCLFSCSRISTRILPLLF
jgi:hypothetical protein